MSKLQERKIYLIRHGQASLGAADYDNLSPLGEQQAEALGAYIAQRGVVFDAVYAGTLKRHSQTYAALLRGAKDTPILRETSLMPNLDAGLNEYDSDAVIGAVATPDQIATMKSPTSSDGYKQHFATLRRGIAAWMRGEVQPVGMTTYAEFAAGVMRVLDTIRESNAQTVLISSSGGPLSSAIAQVLGLDHVSGIELNMRMRNTAVSELIVTPKRCVLLTFNTLPHLPKSMQTYA